MGERIVKYILAGDSKGAVKAMKETAAEGEKTGKQLDKTGKEAESSFKNIEKGAHKIHGAVSLLAGAAGLGGLAFGIKDAVQAGVQMQAQQAQLRNALKGTSDASASAAKRITEVVEASSTHGGFKGQQELEGVAQFVRSTKSSTEALKLNDEAVELARGAHMSYETAVRSVAQVQTGQVGRLSKYLGTIIPVTEHVKELTAQQKKQNPELLKQAQYLDKSATAAEANRRITERYSGVVSSFSRTAAGSVSNAQHAIEALSEKVGQVFLPYVAMAANELSNLIDIGIQKWPEAKVKIDAAIGSVKSIAAWFKKNMDVTKALAAGLVTLVVGIKAVTVATKLWAAAQAFLNLTEEANPIGLIILGIAALTAGVVYCYLHFKTFRTVVQTVFAFLRTATTSVVSFVSKHWKTLVQVLGLPFEPLIQILLHIKSIIHDIVGAAGTISKVYGSVTKAPGSFLGHLVPHFATGGIVPGSGSRDMTPIMATPGEGILTTRAVQALGGPSAVNALNSSGGGFGDLNITLPVKLYVSDGGRVLAETVTSYKLKMGARR